MKTSLKTSSCKTAIALLFLLVTRFAAIAGFDAGSLTSETPFDQYYKAPLQTVYAKLGTKEATMEEVTKMLLQDYRITYKFTNSSAPAAPETTAQRHYGDCKDKSLLLISQLGDSNLRFVIGKDPQNRSHAWVMWNHEGRWWLLDPAQKTKPVLADAAGHYVPLYSYGKGAAYRHAATQFNAAQGVAASRQPVASKGR